MREHIVGIDFGTTGTRVAALLDGRPTILENVEGEGTTPAYVTFAASGKDVWTGAAARRAAEGQDSFLVKGAKRLIGHSYDDPIAVMFRKSMLIPMSRSSNNEPLFQVGDKLISPTAVCQHLFHGIRETASRALKTEVRQAVVATPAYFGILQRSALRRAAAAAGLKILRFVGEPTAAAMFHGFGRQENKTLAIYDFGGGTFDISILQTWDGVFEVRATDGDMFLGGEDITRRLEHHLLGNVGMEPGDLDFASLRRLQDVSDDAKRALSGIESTKVVLTGLLTHSGRSFDLGGDVTRELLQTISQDLVDRSLAICQRAVDATTEANVLGDLGPFSIDDIDEVVLVGGSTRLPFVESSVERYFGRKPISSPRREDAVALGCAIQAGVLNGLVKDSLLLDILPRALGVRLAGENPITVFDRNESFPQSFKLSTSLPYRDDAPLNVKILEGEDNALEKQSVLKHIQLWPMAPDGRARIDLYFSVDANSALTVTIVDSMTEEVLTNDLIDPLADGDIPVDALIEEDAETPKKEPAPRSAALRVLAVGTEWRSGAGGLSTVNRELCVALANKGHDVACLVLEASPQELFAAKSSGVDLIIAVKSPGQSNEVRLSRRPPLPSGWVPELIIGHGRITGPAALSIQADHFPAAKRLHFIHMAPDEIEWHKMDRSDDAGARAELRSRIEFDLGAGATRVVAIGPRLHGRTEMDFSGVGKPPIRLDPGFDSRDVTAMSPPPGNPWRVLLVGRAEDTKLKGLDIAARALGLVARAWSKSAALELMVRGSPPHHCEDLREKLVEWADCPALHIIVRPFDSDVEQLNADYRRASLVLMPSRAEGFGLVGLEAIVSGVPVLASSRSGLGELLLEQLDEVASSQIVIPVTGDLSADAQVWATAIRGVLDHRDKSFDRARTLRLGLQEQKSWRAAVDGLMWELRRDEDIASA